MPAASMASTPCPASASKSVLVRFDNNKYSVATSAVGQQVDYLPIAVIGAPASLRCTRSRAAGRTQSLKGAPLRKAPGLRASTGVNILAGRFLPARLMLSMRVAIGNRGIETIDSAPAACPPPAIDLDTARLNDSGLSR